MTKATTAGMRTHLDGVTTSLASIWRITRTDGQNFYFTDHDRDIDFDDGDGVATYKSNSGFDRSAISNRTGLSVDNLDVQGLLNAGDVTEIDLRAGRFDYADVRISLVNWKNLTHGTIKVRRGRFGEITISQVGVYRTELRGLTQALSQNIVDVYQPECRADLGDAQCKVPILPNVLGRSAAVSLGEFYRVATAGPTGFQSDYENRVYEVTTAGTTDVAQPVYNTSIDATTADGTAVLTARDAFMRHATIATVTSEFVFTLIVNEPRAINDWFNGGAIEFEEGDNAGVVREIVDWVQSSSTVTVFLRFPFTPVVGQRVRLYRGCDKRAATCTNPFGNILNFRGEPFVPGPDVTIKTESG